MVCDNKFIPSEYYLLYILSTAPDMAVKLKMLVKRLFGEKGICSLTGFGFSTRYIEVTGHLIVKRTLLTRVYGMSSALSSESFFYNRREAALCIPSFVTHTDVQDTHKPLNKAHTPSPTTSSSSHPSQRSAQSSQAPPYDTHSTTPSPAHSTTPHQSASCT